MNRKIRTCKSGAGSEQTPNQGNTDGYLLLDIPYIENESGEFKNYACQEIIKEFLKQQQIYWKLKSTL